MVPVLSMRNVEVRPSMYQREAMWLNFGRLMLQGPPNPVVDQYIAAADAAMNEPISLGMENGDECRSLAQNPGSKY